LKKTRRIIITFGNGRFVIPSSDENDFTRDDNIRDKVDFANYMVEERRRSMRKPKRERRRR
jgi:hypothetical protein